MERWKVWMYALMWPCTNSYTEILTLTSCSCLAFGQPLGQSSKALQSHGVIYSVKKRENVL